jgi:UDP-glucuronate decarboxylase
LHNEPITIYGGGTQTRSFCYVDDLVEALLRMMETPTGQAGPLNLGNTAEFTILELAEAVLRLTGSRSQLVFNPLPTDDPKQRRPDISQARKALDGWEPVTPLEEGLKRTIAYFRLSLKLGPAPRTVLQMPPRPPVTDGVEKDTTTAASYSLAPPAAKTTLAPE